MSNYSQITDFSAKDALTTGNPLKLITGAGFDAEFAAIAVAIATKYESGNLASQVQAEAETANTVLMTPLRVAQWADYNAGIVGDLQALADPAADTLLGWDDSASAAVHFTLGTGLAIADTVLSLSHLGLQSLTDPGADRVLFWDDSAGAFAWLSISSAFDITDTTIDINESVLLHDSLSGFVGDEHIAHSGVTLTAGTGLTGGGTIAASRSFALDISGLTSMTVAPAGTDSFLYNDGGTMKQMTYNQAALPSRDVASSGSFASTDVGAIVYWTGTSGTLTMGTGVGQDDCFIVVVNSGSGAVTLAGSGVTMTSANSLLDIPAGGMATLIRESSTVWFVGGSLE